MGQIVHIKHTTLRPSKKEKSRISNNGYWSVAPSTAQGGGGRGSSPATVAAPDPGLRPITRRKSMQCISQE